MRRVFSRRNCFPPFYTILFGRKSLCGLQVRNGGDVPPPWRHSIYRNYLQVRSDTSAPAIYRLSPCELTDPELWIRPYYAISLRLKVLSAQREHFPRALSPFTYRPLPIREALLCLLSSGSSLRGTTRCSRPRIMFSTVFWKFSSPSPHLHSS